MTVFRLLPALLLAWCLPACEETAPVIIQEEPAPQELPAIRYLALGDSYTIGESVSPSERFPVQLADRLFSEGYRVDTVDIIARTGWNTSNLQEAIGQRRPGNDYQLVSLLIGVNNQFQRVPFARYEPELRSLLRQAITFAEGDTSRVFVVSIPDYSATPFGRNFNPELTRQQIDAYNAKKREVAGAFGIPFIDITDISRRAATEPDLLAYDQLHPSAKMYALWVQRILPVVLEMLED